ncbi:MAG: PepSY domain-containing protein [Betaproteobacteria bacterium]|nr:PepSY domain-containing protein [Betaproteobacteria bacterium]
MLNKKIALSGLLALLSGVAMSAHAYTGEKLAKDAKISLQTAQSIALKTYPGKIVKVELEREAGGSGLRYTFDMQKKGQEPHEVGIDAATGKVLADGSDMD